MTSFLSKTLILFLGVALGGTVGYLVADARDQNSPSTMPDFSEDLTQIRTELAELKSQTAPQSVDEQVAQLQMMVADILLRGDEFSLRADFARSADRLGGHKAADFALGDADKDGVQDIEELRQTLDGILTGSIPVAKAKKADSAGNTEFLGNLPPTDFALVEHSHPSLSGDVTLQDDLRVDGALTVAGNLAASGDVQVFGEVVAVGGLLPGAVDVEPQRAIAGMIRYNRNLGTLEYCDGNRWNEIAVVERP